MSGTMAPALAEERGRRAAPAPAANERLEPIALLTGGDDRPYALGMTGALSSEGIRHDFIGSDALDAPELHGSPLVRFLNLRGDQSEDAAFLTKLVRILRYYGRLMSYALTAEPRIFHILWNNKVEAFDRTFLMLWYRAAGRRVVLTAHNVNAAKRDGRDTMLNRLTLRVQYHLCRHILVHTERARRELIDEFGLAASKVSVIPFGINDTIPKTGLSAAEARANLGIADGDRVLLCFGQIAPYKGLEFLVEALGQIETPVHVVIAGKVKRGHESYWDRVREGLGRIPERHRVTQHVRFIPDDEVEVYFKAADLVVLPYTAIFQSGVPFLAFSFGRPVVATDVGALRDDIHDDVTGYICRPRDPGSLAGAIARYFGSELYRQREERREVIRSLALEHHSWRVVGRLLTAVYASARQQGRGAHG
jgi:glycosyltransferase involved in cell wall biosynthesis